MLDASTVLGHLAAPAYQTIASAYNLESDIQELQDSIDIISEYLKDASDRQQKLQEVLEDASDILDEIEYEAWRKQVVKDYASCIKKVRHFCSGSNPIAFRFIMSCKIKGISKRIRRITSYQSKLGLRAVYHGHMNRQSLEEGLSWRETNSRLPSHMTGRDKEKELIIQILKGPQSHYNKIDVIPIVGAGGLGKTTLAQLVYNDKWVADYFETRLWVCVSNDFGLKRLISDILKAEDKTGTESNTQNSNLEQLGNSLLKALSGMRFLLVLDDVWNEDARRWQELYDALLDLGHGINKNGSKIIVTTRSRRVASVMGTSPALQMDLDVLPPEECWKLFEKWAFPNETRQSYPVLVGVGTEIVRKCGGLPLAVVTLGCLLSSNYNMREWKRIQNISDWWPLGKDEDSILPILRLSYNELAPQLKQCFSYCSIFPKDYQYNDLHMISFWMAHGLLQPENDREEPEQVGESYINKLLVKSFFQPQQSPITEFHALVGNINLTMRDIIHGLALSTMRNEQVLVTSGCKTVHKNARHLTFGNNVFPIIGHWYPHKVRTINVLKMEREHREISRFLDWIFNEFKYLRVLDLTGSLLKSLPSSLGDMKYLRYLRLSYCSRLEKLPRSLRDLHILQCLNLEGCDKLLKLPKNMGRFLVSLRNFSITTQDKYLSYIDIGGFKCLQVLTITDCHNLLCLPDLQSLATLKKLFIRRCQNLVTLEDKEGQETNLAELMESAKQEASRTVLTESAEQGAKQVELTESAEKGEETESAARGEEQAEPTASGEQGAEQAEPTGRAEREANQAELTKSAEQGEETESGEQGAEQAKPTENEEQGAEQAEPTGIAEREANQPELTKSAEQGEETESAEQAEPTESGEQGAEQAELTASAKQANPTESGEKGAEQAEPTGSAEREANQAELTKSAKQGEETEGAEQAEPTESGEQGAEQAELTASAEQAKPMESREQGAEQAEPPVIAEREITVQGANQAEPTESAEREANQAEPTESAGLEGLQIFEISDLPLLGVLPSWLTEEASGSLEVLCIRNCPLMSSLPEEMENLRKLQHLFIMDCPLEKKLRTGNSDRSKIPNITKIHFN